MIVVDASVVVAALLDSAALGDWAINVMAQDSLAAPEILDAEVTNLLRRQVLAGRVSDEIASLARVDFDAVTLDRFPFAPFGERVWELRRNVTAYDGWYVALAEAIESPLATLDGRLARASGPRCSFWLPPAS